MGIFSRISKNITKTNNHLEKLKNLGIDFESYRHEDLEPLELTIDDEVEGVVKSSDLFFEDDNALFNYVHLIEKENDVKEISFSKSNSDEYAIKDMVDSFYQALGEDYFLKNEFDSEDLENIRIGEGQGLRRWDDESGYHILLGYNTESEIINLFILND